VSQAISDGRAKKLLDTAFFYKTQARNGSAVTRINADIIPVVLHEVRRPRTNVMPFRHFDEFKRGFEQGLGIISTPGEPE